MEINEQNHNYEVTAEGQFSNFPLSIETVQRLQSQNINFFFPIQARTFNQIFTKKDVIGRDRTGSGKTIAFLLPVIERMRQEKCHFK